TEIRGFDKLQKGKSYVILGKHESTWETIVMHTFINPAPIFVLKKQLLRVPFLGWCLAFSNNIPIDRNAGAGSIRKILKEGRKYIEKGHSLVIFPQGTRVLPTTTPTEVPYKIGFIEMVRQFKCDIAPMALNSGKFWGKKKFLKPSGTIRMEFMDIIKYEDIKNMSKEELLEVIQSKIETKSKELYELE
ncbi:MAG: 1-acyl-sn-glycerol-3-phosphate acyltransferase, partial [Rickettsiales bacterium]|nr:1-acyl-sn-glycerol-3-phosphate acyltransferase [Rickettsiales bacterium]